VIFFTACRFFERGEMLAGKIFFLVFARLCVTKRGWGGKVGTKIAYILK
jgi:hypothetical protein